jgi:hypothetical protein
MTKNSWRRFFAHKLDEAEVMELLDFRLKVSDVSDDIE